VASGRSELGLGRLLARNLTLQAASQGITIAISVMTIAVLVRRLDVEAFGGYTFLFTFILFFLSFNDLGIPTTLLREITQAPDRTVELVQSIIGLRLVMAIVSMAVGAAIVSWLNLPPAYRLPQLVFLLILPLQAFATPMVILQSRIHMGRMVVAELANRLTGFLCIVAAVAFGGGLLWVTASLVAGEIAGTLAVVFMTRTIATPVPRFDLRVWKHIIRLSLPLSGTSLMVAVLNRIDMILLQKMSPNPETGLARVGYYGSAYRVPNMCERVPLLMMGTVFPLMVTFAAEDLGALRRLYWKTLAQLTAAALPMVAIVTIAAPYLIRAWMGPEYAAVVPLMRALIWASALLYVALPAANLLIAMRFQKINFWMMIPATLLNVGLNLALIPKYGALGAAWATVAAYGFLAVGYLIAVEVIMPKAIEARA
jgi:O-antigen/teichoic acid export membrane protein